MKHAEAGGANSLIITCEVGGNAIPPWLGPHLAQIGEEKRKSKTQKNKSNKTTSKRSQNLQSIRPAIDSRKQDSFSTWLLPKALHADRDSLAIKQ